MPNICQLSTSVINKIAAGEVIERPASVVKELLENSLDAGATRIEVAVEKGGAESIRITDNGCGIAADQLSLAVASHATSKIVDADDLFRVETLGFRGEALASIVEVSRLVLRSRPADCESGAELEVVGGRAEPIRPVGCPPGTSVEVRQLFFNTPVRQKFLRTTQTEMGHVTEAVTRLALGCPGVHFSLSHGGRLVHDLPPVDDLRQRVAILFGEPLAESLIQIDSLTASVTCPISVWVVRKNFCRTGVLKNSCRTSTDVPGGQPTGRIGSARPPTTSSSAPDSQSAGRLLSTRRLTSAIDASASPRGR